MKINSWTILNGKHSKRNEKIYVEAKCDCGVTKIVQKSSIVNEYSKCCASCARAGNLNALEYENQVVDGKILCQKCFEYLDISEYYSNKRNKYRMNTERHCKKCDRAKQRKYLKKRRDSDPLFRMITNMRNRISQALLGKGRSFRSFSLLGCNSDEYKKYIEDRFSDGMSWNNYGNKKGQWNIDHVIPLSSFDLSVPEEQFKAFNYKNTRPMWSDENNKKRARMPDNSESM